jgi:hypothetical protein
MKGAIKFLFLFCAFFGAHAAFAAPIVPGSFSTTWKTDNAGVSNNDQIRIPTDAGLAGVPYNYNIYWEEIGNDGNNGSSTAHTGDVTITFPSPGTYRVDITGDFPMIRFPFSSDKRKILTIEQWGNIAWRRPFQRSMRLI